MIRPFLARLENRSESNHAGVRVNYSASYWTPPMTPKLAFDLESKQIEDLGIASVWSPSPRSRQHQARLHAAAYRSERSPDPGFRGVERALWRRTGFPSRHTQPAQRQGCRVDADPRELASTDNPSAARSAFGEILAALNDEPNVMVIFNHPLWDLFMVGKEKHQFLVNEFLLKYGNFMHALELNGLPQLG